jgi:hypothetical protein
MTGKAKIDRDTEDLLAKLTDPDQCPRAGYVAVQQKIKRLRDTGAPVPAALVSAERHLQHELMAHSQGR